MKKVLFIMIIATLLLSCNTTKKSISDKKEIVIEKKEFKVFLPPNYGSKEYFDSLYVKKNKYAIKKFLYINMPMAYYVNHKKRFLESGNYLITLTPIRDGFDLKTIEKIRKENNSDIKILELEDFKIFFEQVDDNLPNKSSIVSIFTNGKSKKLIFLNKKDKKNYLLRYYPLRYDLRHKYIIYVLSIKKI